MKSFFTTKRLCRAGIIAALYTALTYAFAPLAFGPFQVRPAEALCILALIYPEEEKYIKELNCRIKSEVGFEIFKGKLLVKNMSMKII